MKRTILTAAALAFAGYAAAQPQISERTSECITCHSTVTPGIVEDWRRSLHAQTTPRDALAKPKGKRRLSSASVPIMVKETVVGCYECHGLNPDKHKDNFEHFGHKINVVVTPNDCAVCHEKETKQYAGTKKSEALGNLRDNPLYHTLVETVTGKREFKSGHLGKPASSLNAKLQTCYACHGSEVTVKGMKTIEHPQFGEIEIPDLENWPNQGVGRINPDGSKGSCASCHARHAFSIEVARKPYTCMQCHMGPDLPAWDVYKESKHGNLFLSEGKDYNWKSVPWTVGKDFTAPTCAVCHNAGLVNLDGDTIVEGTHDFGARLWKRIFGLIYSHPQPKHGATHTLRNADGQPLPTTFDGVPAAEGLISKEEAAKREATMRSVCLSCHSTDWVDGHFESFDKAVDEADAMVRSATALIQKGWKSGKLDPTNPFDETLERKWVELWLIHANSTRYAAAMSGPDYAAFDNGWWGMSSVLQELEDELGD
jgi:cytochrome c553